MADPVDFYCDQFQINMGPYGATLNFMVSGAEPPPPGQQPRTERLATARMSLEHLKVLTFMLRTQVKFFEDQTNVTIQIPQDVLNALRIGREDWDAFWR